MRAVYRLICYLHSSSKIDLSDRHALLNKILFEKLRRACNHGMAFSREIVHSVYQVDYADM